MVSPNLRHCLVELNALARKRTKGSRMRALNKLPKKKIECLYDAMREVIANIYNENIKLNNRQYGRLVRHKKLLKALAHGSRNPQQRTKLVKQFGGIFPAFLIPILAGIAGTAAGKILDKVIPK